MKILTDPKKRGKLRDALQALIQREGNHSPARMRDLQAYALILFWGVDAAKERLASLGVQSRQHADHIVEEVTNDLGIVGYHENGR